MAIYKVANKTNVTIFWRDGGWLSGDLAAGDIKTVETDHDADVTIWAKVGGSDRDWGRVWIHKGRTLEVSGDRTWCLK